MKILYRGLFITLHVMAGIHKAHVEWKSIRQPYIAGNHESFLRALNKLVKGHTLNEDKKVYYLPDKPN